MAQAVLRAIATVAAKFLVNSVVSAHGCPKEIFTDCGIHFTGQVVQKILRLLDIEHLLTSAYHPQANSNSERALKIFVTILSYYASTDQKNCDQVVAFAASVINTAKSRATSCCPFEVVFGRSTVNLVDIATKIYKKLLTPLFLRKWFSNGCERPVESP